MSEAPLAIPPVPDLAPTWLLRELRSDHAGETGAVAIYQGILAVTRDPAVRDFARRHLATEREHLVRMRALLAPGERSRLLGLWRVAGWLTGALPALLGPGAVFVTIDAVESFVDEHYRRQIDALTGRPEWARLRATLVECRTDELAHRDEARAASPAPPGTAARVWRWLVGAGSALAVAAARRV